MAVVTALLYTMVFFFLSMLISLLIDNYAFALILSLLAWTVSGLMATYAFAGYIGTFLGDEKGIGSLIVGLSPDGMIKNISYKALTNFNVDLAGCIDNMEIEVLKLAAMRDRPAGAVVHRFPAEGHRMTRRRACLSAGWPPTSSAGRSGTRSRSPSSACWSLLALANGLGSIKVLPTFESWMTGDVFIGVGLSQVFFNISQYCSVAALVLGLLSVAGDRKRVLGVLLTKPVLKRDVVAGKFIGLSAFMLLLITVTYLLVSLLITLALPGPVVDGRVHAQAFGADPGPVPGVQPPGGHRHADRDGLRQPEGSHHRRRDLPVHRVVFQRHVHEPAEVPEPVLRLLQDHQRHRHRDGLQHGRYRSATGWARPSRTLP